MAKATGLSLNSLISRIGVSPAAFWGYRSGKLRVTPKALAKLERAERDAGIQGGLVTRDKSAGRSPAAGIIVTRDNYPPAAPEAHEARISRLEASVTRMAEEITRLVRVLENQTGSKP